MAPLLDHLWQSTMVAALMALLTLALQSNSARIRFWLWFAASLKFLVPFAALAAPRQVTRPAGSGAGLVFHNPMLRAACVFQFFF